MTSGSSTVQTVRAQTDARLLGARKFCASQVWRLKLAELITSPVVSPTRMTYPASAQMSSFGGFRVSLHEPAICWTARACSAAWPTVIGYQFCWTCSAARFVCSLTRTWSPPLKSAAAYFTHFTYFTDLRRRFGLFRAEDPDQPADAADDERHRAKQNRDHRPIHLSQAGVAERDHHRRLAHAPAGDRYRHHSNEHDRRDQHEYLLKIRRR